MFKHKNDLNNLQTMNYTINEKYQVSTNSFGITFVLELKPIHLPSYRTAVDKGKTCLHSLAATVAWKNSNNLFILLKCLTELSFILIPLKLGYTK